MMTRKHYEAIARIINENQYDNDVIGIQRDLSKYFKKDNPKFNEDLFLKACLVEE